MCEGRIIDLGDLAVKLVVEPVVPDDVSERFEFDGEPGGELGSGLSNTMFISSCKFAISCNCILGHEDIRLSCELVTKT